MNAGLLYANVLSPSTRKHIMGKSYPKCVDDKGKSAMVSARVGLEFMKVAIEELKSLEEMSKPQKMDVSSVAAAEAYTHQEWDA